MRYLHYSTAFCSLFQIRCRELHVENSQLQEENQRLRQHCSVSGGGGGGGGGQRVRQLQEDIEHLRHQVCVYACVHACACVCACVCPPSVYMLCTCVCFCVMCVYITLLCCGQQSSMAQTGERLFTRNFVCTN